VSVVPSFIDKLFSFWTPRTQAVPRLRPVTMLQWFSLVRAGFWFWWGQMVDIAERGYEHWTQQHSSFLFRIARYSSLETRAGVMPLTSMLIRKEIIRSLLKTDFICEQGEQISTYVHVISNGRQCKRIEHNKFHCQALLYSTLPTYLLRMRSTTGNVGRTQTRNETLMTSVGRSWRSPSVVLQFKQKHTEYSFHASWRTAREGRRSIVLLDYRNIPMCVLCFFFFFWLLSGTLSYLWCDWSRGMSIAVSGTELWGPQGVRSMCWWVLDKHCTQ